MKIKLTTTERHIEGTIKGIKLDYGNIFFETWYFADGRDRVKELYVIDIRDILTFEIKES